MELEMSALPKTWVFDLDGTLVEHNGYKKYGKDIWLDGAREFLLSLPKDDMLIIVTSRTREYAHMTEEFLNKSGIHCTHIIYGAPYGERILINDAKPSGLCMAYAVGKARDSAFELGIKINADL